ncbi:hypothetical protein PMSD_20705 [Paenibacillus macquariensis subsp. defensor]|nr:hypothetical protein PMSD_20705 [Paenibacillus macquariensis subsp. defensor]
MDKKENPLETNMVTVQIEELLKILEGCKETITSLETGLKERLIHERLILKEKRVQDSELPRHLTANHIVEYTGLSKNRIYEFLGINPEYGGIPCFRIGSTVLSKREEFLVWWDEQIKHGTRVYASHDPYNLGFKKPDKFRILTKKGYLRT